MNYENILLDCLKDVSHNPDDIWVGAKFELIRLISLTHRGDVGEKFFQEYCNTKIEYACVSSFTDNTLVPTHFCYDSLVFTYSSFYQCAGFSIEEQREIGIKVEVKTASLSKNDVFQFDNIRNDGWEFVVLIGIYPNNIGFRILSNTDVFYNRTMCEMASTAEGNQKLVLKSTEMKDIDLLDDVFDDTIGKAARNKEKEIFNEFFN